MFFCFFFFFNVCACNHLNSLREGEIRLKLIWIQLDGVECFEIASTSLIEEGTPIFITTFVIHQSEVQEKEQD